MSLPKKTILGHMDCLGLELTSSNDEIKTNQQIFQFEGEDKQERVCFSKLPHSSRPTRQSA